MQEYLSASFTFYIRPAKHGSDAVVNYTGGTFLLSALGSQVQIAGPNISVTLQLLADDAEMLRSLFEAFHLKGLRPNKNQSDELKIGDIVEFKVGGFGVVSALSRHEGWSVSYQCSPASGLPEHPTKMEAWFTMSNFKTVYRATHPTLKVSDEK